MVGDSGRPAEPPPPPGAVPPMGPPLAPAGPAGGFPPFPEPAAAPRSSYGTLGDWFSFRRMITPLIIQGLFICAVALSILTGLALVIGPIIGYLAVAKEIPADEHGYALMAVVGCVLSGILVAFVGTLVSRLMAESLVVVFRINETLTDILHEIRQRNLV
jgi:hypothetical protein